MEWQSVKTPPLMVERCGFHEARNILVWIDDKSMVGFARGACYKFYDGEVKFKADGFNGDWRITHWMNIEAPKPWMDK